MTIFNRRIHQTQPPEFIIYASKLVYFWRSVCECVGEQVWQVDWYAYEVYLKPVRASPFKLSLFLPVLEYNKGRHLINRAWESGTATSTCVHHSRCVSWCHLQFSTRSMAPSASCSSDRGYDSYRMIIHVHLVKLCMGKALGTLLEDRRNLPAGHTASMVIRHQWIAS